MPSSATASPQASAPTSLAAEVEEASSPSHVAVAVAATASCLSDDVRRHGLAAVLLDEWLVELAAIAQEQSTLQKERAFEIRMGLDERGARWRMTQYEKTGSPPK